MVKPRMRIAHLDEASLAKLQQLEQAMGTTILAVEPLHPVAELSQEQLERLQQLEQALGVVLVAYEKNTA